MNQRTIVLPADTLSFSVTFADPLASALSTRFGQAAGQAEATSQQTGEVNSTDTAEGTTDTADTADIKESLSYVCDASDVIEAIRSDSRFSQRSLAAIQKYLSHIEPGVVAERVNTMRLEDELISRVRRNGETVYSAA